MPKPAVVPVAMTGPVIQELINGYAVDVWSVVDDDDDEGEEWDDD